MSQTQGASPGVHPTNTSLQRMQDVTLATRNLEGEWRDLDCRICDHQMSLAAMATGEDITYLLELLGRQGGVSVRRVGTLAAIKDMAAHLARALQPDQTAQHVAALAIRLARHKGRLDIEVNHAVWDHVAATQLVRDVKWLLHDTRALRDSTAQSSAQGGDLGTGSAQHMQRAGTEVFEAAIGRIEVLERGLSTTLLNAVVARSASQSMRSAITDLVAHTIPAWLAMADHHKGVAQGQQVEHAAGVLASAKAQPSERVAAARILARTVVDSQPGPGSDKSLQAGLQVLQALRNSALEQTRSGPEASTGTQSAMGVEQAVDQARYPAGPR